MSEAPELKPSPLANLKPCPFCGSKEIKCDDTYSQGSISSRLFCKSCFASTRRVYTGDTYWNNELIELWNTRITLADLEN